MLGINMSNIESAGNYPKPKPDGYVIRIEKVENNKQKERLDIEFDIAEGEFAGYYKDMQERNGWHTGKFSKSYRTKAQPFLKGFIEAVIKSNPPESVEGLVIGDFADIEESKLVSLIVGMVVGEKEYIGVDGKKKIHLDTYNATFIPVDRIRAGDYTVPELRTLTEEAPESSGVVDMSVGFTPTVDDDVPF